MPPTLYMQIKLNNTVTRKVGVFIPEHFKPTATVSGGFECLYFGTGTWSTWLSDNTDKQFKHFRQPTQQRKPTNELKDHKNFVDIPNSSDHCTLLKENWRQAIDKCGPLHPTNFIA
jgi:hypothetical protein